MVGNQLNRFFALFSPPSNKINACRRNKMQRTNSDDIARDFILSRGDLADNGNSRVESITLSYPFHPDLCCDEKFSIRTTATCSSIQLIRERRRCPTSRSLIWYADMPAVERDILCDILLWRTTRTVSFMRWRELSCRSYKWHQSDEKMLGEFFINSPHFEKKVRVAR